LQASAAIVTIQAAIPVAVTGLTDAATQTNPTAAMLTRSFVADKIGGQ